MAKTLNDPNVREAMREIRAILKKRNLAGHVIIGSPTHTEYALMYDAPTWSAVCISKKRTGEMFAEVIPQRNRDIELAKMSVTRQVLEQFESILAKSRLTLSHVIYNLQFNLTVVDFYKYHPGHRMLSIWR